MKSACMRFIASSSAVTLAGTSSWLILSSISAVGERLGFWTTSSLHKPDLHQAVRKDDLVDC